MSWMQCLYKTYEEGIRLDISEDLKPIPVSHTIQNAHINIDIDGRGNFRRANVLEKTQIVLPATEKSAGRSSGEAAHPLADKLQYIAGDYKAYGGEKSAYFESYRQQLDNWCQSEHGHSSIQSVLDYVSKRQVIQDLVACQIAWLDSNGKLLRAWPDQEGEAPMLFKVLPKEKGTLDQGNALVCWSVEDEEIECPDTWKDRGLQEQWIAYDSSNAGVTGLCYVSGEIQPLALSHPAKLRHSGDKAKLISSNDLGGFTFKGRFTDSKTSIENHGLQSVGVGVVTTQKAHNALRWLINRPKQAFRNGEQAIVAWAVSGKQIPSPLVATTDFDLDNFDEVEGAESSMNGVPESVIDHSIDVGQSFATKLTSYMRGYRARLSDTDQISIMAIDSATPGRMGITYYRETLPQEYIERITRWHMDLAWPQRVVIETPQKKGKPKQHVTWPISAPSPFLILNAVYGDILQSNKALKKTLIEQLIPCITEQRNIPQGIVYRAVSRACNRNAKRLSEEYSNRNSELAAWEKELAVACALYKSYLTRNLNRSDISMALDESNTSRDYLYGRMLALADNIESYALNKSDERRPTSAERLMQRFADRPFSTWRNIELALRPYINRLKAGDEKSRGFAHARTQLMSNIQAMFVDAEQFKLDKSLSGEFLLGFHCQRLALNQKPETKIDTKPEITEEQGA